MSHTQKVFFENQKRGEARRAKEYRLAENEKELKSREQRGQTKRELHQRALEEETHHQDQSAQTQVLIKMINEHSRRAVAEQQSKLEERQASRLAADET
jgi:hypothetical protein